MTRIQINDDWRFTKEGETSSVTLPHTWNGLDGQDGGNDYYRGTCTYERVLVIDDDASKTVHLEFEGANSIANLYVNGLHVGEHKGGYSTFRFDITEFVKLGQGNDIRVEVDNAHYDDIYPLMADFTFMGGLYRNVNLIYSAPIHIDLEDDGSSGVYVSQTSVSASKAELAVDVLLRNRGTNADTVLIDLQFEDADGKPVASEQKTVSVEKHGRASVQLDIDKPHLWHGTEDPYLYTLHVELRMDGEVLDRRAIQTGLRYFQVDPKKGFFLNGQAHRLNGVCRHQDRQDIGWALLPEHQDEDMAIIEEIGANSIRLAHYQHNQYFYDLCDKSGMVVWAEIPYISRTSPTDTEGTNALSQMRELVKQNYNHASIVFWGVQNEITITGKTNKVDETVKALHDLTRELDPYRLTTQAQVAMLPDKDPLNSVTDVNAYNKYYGWYHGDVSDMDDWIAGFHAKNPDIPLGISEYGAEGILAYHTDDPKRSDYSEEYHAFYHQKSLEIFARHECLWGTYVWNMFDFASDLRDEGGVKGMNNKGLVTHDHKTRKDAFYIYQAHWSKKPMLHIASKRFEKRASDEIAVTVYSNQPEVSLSVDGQAFRTQTSDNHVFRFEGVPLSAGTTAIEASAGGLTDTATFDKVAEPVASYTCPEGKNRRMGGVDNWFEESPLNGEELPLEFPEGYFSVKSRIGDVIDNPEGEAFVREHLPALFDHPMFEFIKNLSFIDMSELADGLFSPAVMSGINQRLNKIRKS